MNEISEIYFPSYNMVPATYVEVWLFLILLSIFIYLIHQKIDIKIYNKIKLKFLEFLIYKNIKKLDQDNFDALFWYIKSYVKSSEDIDLNFITLEDANTIFKNRSLFKLYNFCYIYKYSKKQDLELLKSNIALILPIY